MPHKPPRTATEGSGTLATSALSFAALNIPVVAAKLTITETNLEGADFIVLRGPAGEHILR